MKNKKLTCFITIFIFVLDYITKYVFNKKNFVIIKNWLSIKYTENSGAAWSIFDGQRMFLIALSLLFLGILFYYSFKFKNNIRNKIAFGLLFGGLLGNLMDRIIFGYVRDFISVILFSYNYPIFNIADCAIVIGIVLILIAILKKEDESDKVSSR